MPTLKEHTIIRLKNALVDYLSAKSIIDVVQAASGTVSASARRDMGRALCSSHASTRLCDMIDNKTGTISVSDIRAVKTALASKTAGDDFLTAVYTNAGGSYLGTGV